MRNRTAVAWAASLVMLAGCSPASVPTSVAKPTTVATSAPSAVAPTQASPVVAAASPPAVAAPTSASPAAAVAPSPAAPAPAASAPSPAPPAPVAGVQLADGRAHPGPYFLGRADAPVTLDEYADFQ